MDWKVQTEKVLNIVTKRKLHNTDLQTKEKKIQVNCLKSSNLPFF